MFPAQWAVILHILLITCSEFEALQVGPVNVCLKKNNRDFKKIATATSTTGVVDAVSWGEYVS